LVTAEQDYSRIWQAVLEDLKGSTTPSIFEQRLKGTRCIGLHDRVLTVAVPNDNDLHFLQNRIARHVQHAMVAVGAHHLQVRYVVEGEAGAHLRPGAESPREGGNGAGIVDRVPGMTPLFGTGTPSLRDRYTFETFIVGKNNELAHAAALGVADEPGRKYNPLFIWGTVGLGKTHLLHAIAHRVKQKFPTMQVHYTSSETFVNDMIAAIRENRNEAYERFHHRYRHVDVLLIDDIQFISGKEGTQEEFFHTFNALHGAEKQIVLTSDRAPQAMTLLEERLRSRFAGGLIADIQMPDYETRVAILRTWAEGQTIPVPLNVVDFVARRVQSSVRQMEGTLNTILQNAAVLKTPVTIDLAESVLEGMGVGRRRRQVTLQDVLNAVSQHYKVDHAALTGKQRDKVIALPRHVAMYLMREETGASLPAIGTFLGGRDHTTVMHGCEKITRELEHENLPLRKDVLAVRGLLYEMQ
jgi:chromosomal replication initiator protein